MKKIHLLFLIFLIVSLSGCTPKGCSFLPETSLEILQYNLEKTSETAQIVGVARNNGSAKLDYTEVKGKFYDEEGTLLASAFDSTTDLSPRGIWEFTISYPSEPIEKEAHPSLKILSYRLEKSSSEARIVGQAHNDGDVTLSFAQITGEFYDEEDTLLASSITSTTDLEVGEVWDFSIVYPKEDWEEVDDISVEVTTTDYPDITYYGPAEQVDHAAVEVGTLRGSTVMP